ncbi:MAG: isoprenylcysteine carboxylmethyltransferase family protein [Candidatus Omnitrophica bacterium]|nr:isoprenylcysteine carboxylmethyltransferase family protein [Candidatus Omnitrophota bacterium]
MTLRESMEKQGNWLFKWRSYFPLLGIPVLLMALSNANSIEKTYGDLAGGLWGILCISISFLGFSIRCLTAGYVSAGTSGRNTQSQVAEMLNTTGMYSLVQHPLYLGNFIIMLGLALFTQVWWFVLIICLAFWIYYERIIFAEEEFLTGKFGDSFLDWTAKTPIFFPNFRKLEKPALQFSVKTVLRREFSTFFAIIVSFTILHTVIDIITEGKLKISLLWIIFFGGGLIIYLILYFLKKKTRILHVKGR